MSKEKKSQVDDLKKLRRILDNSSDPSIKNLLSKDDQALASVHRRLSGEVSTTQTKSDRFTRSAESLRPRVYVHTKIADHPRVTIPPPKPEPASSLPEFTLASTTTTTTPPVQEAVSFAAEDLFEVEKVEAIVPEFLEVTPKEPAKKPLETDISKNDTEKPTFDSDIPEWQPVKEEHIAEPDERHHKIARDDSSEHEQASISISPEPSEKQVKQESFLTEESPRETSVEFLPVESPEPFFKLLTKKQQRKEKKRQRKKERAEKRQKKCELKQLKKENRQRERKAQQINTEQYSQQQLPEQPPSESEFESKIEEPQIKVNLNAFNGIESIDEKTAELLYKNGFFSIENLKDATIDDLVQIRGIKRKHAKQIKQEIEQKIKKEDQSDFLPIKQRTTHKKPTVKLRDSSEWESHQMKERTKKQSSLPPCIYKGYTLYTRETKNHDGKKTTIHFFSKEKPDLSSPVPLPTGYQIAVNKKTGIPYLKKKR